MSLLHMLDDPSEKKLIFALQQAINTAVSKGTSEPDIVAQLTYLMPYHINKLNLGSGAGFSIKVGGVFVHQTPKVHFSGMVDGQKSIEIGDLLLVNTYKHGGNITRKAMLYQAKVTDKYPAKPDNKNQHMLYSKWPKFTYVSSRPILNGQIRNVTGPDLHSAAKYLLLSKNRLFHLLLWLYHSKLGMKSGYAASAHATSPLSNHECFIKESYHFTLGDAGKEFEILDPSDPDIGWSKVINDLLQVTALKVTSAMRKASAGTNPTRGCFAFGERMSFINTDYHIDEVPPENIPPDIAMQDDEDGDGISVVEFIITSEEELGSV